MAAGFSISKSTVRAEVRFWACFAVVFALFSQALFPVQALAMQMHGPAWCGVDQTVTAQNADAPADKPGLMGLKCADCVLASITGVALADPGFQPVVHAIWQADFAPAMPYAPAQARAPPRPFSCGPPTLV